MAVPEKGVLEKALQPLKKKLVRVPNMAREVQA